MSREENNLEAALWAYRAGLAEAELHVAKKVIEIAKILQEGPFEFGIEEATWEALRMAIEEYDRVSGDDG